MAENVTDIAAAHVAGIDLDYRAPSGPEHLRNSLPAPVLTDDAGWIDLYWRAWSIAFDKIRVPDEQTGLVGYCDAAFSHNIFQWDTCFMLRFLRYSPQVFKAFGSLDNFYLKQHDDGFICREINSITGSDFWDKTHKSSINPPLFADAEWSLYEATADEERVARVLPALIRYHQWLSKNRRSSDGIGYWTTALASGMDNSPRAHDQGGLDVHEGFGYTWLCMTAQMALSAMRIGELASVAGESETARSFRSEYEMLAGYVRATFWNDEAGFYADRRPDGTVSDVLTPATCWPLLLPGEPEERVTRIENALLDENRLGRAHMVPSLSADHELYDSRGNYWRGSVWPPMVYLAAAAMSNCGRDRTAIRIAENHLGMIGAVFQKTGTFWENYAPDSTDRGQIARPEFVGWAGCGPIAMLIETIIGISVSAFDRRVNWRIGREDRHGVKNLVMGGSALSVVYDPATTTVQASTDEAFELEILRQGRSYNFNVPAGESTLDLL